MSYLLDTNVVCEVVKPNPAPQVIGWLEQVPDVALHLSVLSVGEIRKGVEKLADGPKKERLRLWLEMELPAWFEDRLLSVDHGVAERWGQLLAGSRRTLPAVDSLLAATALHHELRLVTRNARDFEIPELIVVNPWSTQ
ncbi:toxin FitB [Methylomarinovum tepidoasis]|uniref:Ribonuclease VapC n=1 Tax=Methylomarinovum tepidoasis TaxID=2840183 RepID=A0AAU9C7Y0_9GAMM|nr:type II toxin-antitoxin system VapC family toxin [Methylomarinovum sp. IN45]BCX88545.1 toxin FitB [Methylomarinovum sp. IN45]